MLNYEICKKLKEVGFPQESGFFVYENGTIQESFNCQYCPDAFRDVQSSNDNALSPTLSELIEACGKLDKHFFGLSNFSSVPGWEAGQYNGYGVVPFKALGATPEEAVANLYLALHKK